MRSSLKDPLVARSDLGSAYDDQQATYLRFGASCFLTGLVIFAIAGTLSGGFTTAAYAYALFAQAILQTVGLLFIISGDIDYDQFVNEHPWSATGFTSTYLLYLLIVASSKCAAPDLSGYGRFCPISQVYWLEAPPFLYFLLRHRQITAMQPRFPRFTTLVAATLVLDQIMWGIWHLIIRLPTDNPAATASIHIIGALFMAATFYYRGSVCGESLSFSLGKIICFYLLVWGTGDLSFYLFNRNLFPPIRCGFGVVHLLLTAIFICFQ
jgi:hypothetical protein